MAITSQVQLEIRYVSKPIMNNNKNVKDYPIETFA